MMLGAASPTPVIDTISLRDDHPGCYLDRNPLPHLLCRHRREVIEHEHNGLLVPFFDIEQLADRAVQALAAPADFRALPQAARQTLVE